MKNERGVVVGCSGGVVESADTRGEGGLKVNLTYITKIAEDEEKVALDKEAILSEISRLGGDWSKRLRLIIEWG